jgi:radical SAM protein with 4Fe4S-binding SPASM domain
MTLSYDEMTTFLQFLRRRYFERPGFIGLDYAFALDPFVGSFHSREGRDHFFIDYRGDVFPSTGMERDAFKVGNALDEDLADVLRRPTLVPESPVRDDLRGICSTCDKFDDCLGGPRGIAFMFSGNFHSSPELCLYHEYRERQHILGSAIWPRMLSGVDLPQLRALRRTIDTQLATRGE